ncbi:MAG: disulfide bond formation protein B [Burkholderiales bacterium]|nr:disulfide bond formation protein B [Burkholderiales bacterium]MDP2397374.1 disulfide bond formation protein B [Burkholderiales bacterium]
MDTRYGYIAGAAICAGLLGFGLYLQHVDGQDPCPLCIFQRVAFIALGAVYLVAAIHGPGRTGAVVYAVLGAICAATGAGLAARHVWLQSLPADQVPACGPGLAYMMEQFPLMRMLQSVLSGSGECAEADWRFLGLTIAGWSLLWFIVLGVYVVWLAWQRRRLTV